MRSPRGPIYPTRSIRGGGAIVELAICLPLLMVILLVCVDGCRLFFAYTTIANAARNGALWATDPLANNAIAGITSQSPYASVTAAAEADTTNLNPSLASEITAGTGSVTQSGTVTAGSTVTVTVTYKFTPITSYLGMSSITMKRAAAMVVAPLAP